MRQTLVSGIVAAAAVCVFSVSGCGGGGSGTSPSPAPAPAPSPAPTPAPTPTPSPTPTPTPSPTPSPTPGGGTTFTITSAGVSPKSVTIAAGTRVTFINNDTRTHDMESDPHPEHTDCPAINQVGFMTPGQTKLTGNLNAVRTCGFHDHDQSENRNLQGTIVIQ